MLVSILQDKVQRAYVWKHCVHPLLIRWPVLLLKTGISLCIVVPATRYGCFDTLPRIMTIMFVGIFVIPDIVDLLTVSRSIEKIRGFISCALMKRCELEHESSRV